MPQIKLVRRSGELIAIEAWPGRSLMENVRAAGVNDIEAICGGNRACATCHVYVSAGHDLHLDQPAADERDLLDLLVHTKPNSRLACQIPFVPALDGITIIVAPEE